MLANSLNSVKSYQMAAGWYAKAAAQGHAKAQYNLAVLYAHGNGMEQSDERAAELYVKAAEAGGCLGRDLGRHLGGSLSGGLSGGRSAARVELQVAITGGAVGVCFTVLVRLAFGTATSTVNVCFLSILEVIEAAAVWGWRLGGHLRR